MKFIGIDFGWISGASGLCCLRWENNELYLEDIDRLDALADILTWINKKVPAPEPGMIAVDAPTIINNATGMRLCDRLTHKYFGRYHAGCYPANLKSRFAARTVGFSKSLEALGFEHAPELEPRKYQRYQIEVFPHPAIINLFGLSQIIKYKKGTLTERRAGLEKLQKYIINVLPKLEPKLDILKTKRTPREPEDLFGDLSVLSNKNLKAVEDRLDALICAYIAAHWWYWGLERNWVLGEGTGGYIIIPKTGINDIKIPQFSNPG